MTAEEKRARFERKRRTAIRLEMNKQCAIFNFYRLYKYDDEDAQKQLALEAKAARERYEFLEKSL